MQIREARGLLLCLVNGASRGEGNEEEDEAEAETEAQAPADAIRKRAAIEWK